MEDEPNLVNMSTTINNQHSHRKNSKTSSKIQQKSNFGTRLKRKRMTITKVGLSKHPENYF